VPRVSSEMGGSERSTAWHVQGESYSWLRSVAGRADTNWLKSIPAAAHMMRGR